MKIERHHVNGWSQSALIPPEFVRIEVSVHLRSSSHRAQVGIEIRDSGTDSILGLSTWSISTENGPDELLASVAEGVALAIQEHHFPF